MRAAALICVSLLALAACKPLAQMTGMGGGKQQKLPLVGQQKQDAEKTACVAKGGRWIDFNGGYLCQHDTRDTGKMCHSRNDCEGECLARSQTCAPVTPLMGCNDVMTEAGYPMTTCVN